RRMTAHLDAEALAYGGGAAVSADKEIALNDPRRAGEIVADGRNDAVGLLLEADQLGLVMQRERRKRGGEPLDDRIEHVLRHALALLRALLRAGLEGAAGEFLAAKLVAGERGEPDVVLRIVARIGRVAHPVGDAPAAAELHCAHADEVHLRVLDPAVGLLDQGAGEAAPAEVARERKPDRAGANDENRSAGAVHRVAFPPATGLICNQYKSARRPASRRHDVPLHLPNLAVVPFRGPRILVRCPALLANDVEWLEPVIRQGNITAE